MEIQSEVPIPEVGPNIIDKIEALEQINSDLLTLYDKIGTFKLTGSAALKLYCTKYHNLLTNENNKTNCNNIEPNDYDVIQYENFEFVTSDDIFQNLTKHFNIIDKNGNITKDKIDIKYSSAMREGLHLQLKDKPKLNIDYIGGKASTKGLITKNYNKKFTYNLAKDKSITLVDLPILLSTYNDVGKGDVTNKTNIINNLIEVLEIRPLSRQGPEASRRRRRPIMRNNNNNNNNGRPQRQRSRRGSSGSSGRRPPSFNLGSLRNSTLSPFQSSPSPSPSPFRRSSNFRTSSRSSSSSPTRTSVKGKLFGGGSRKKNIKKSVKKSRKTKKISK